MQRRGYDRAFAFKNVCPGHLGAAPGAVCRERAAALRIEQQIGRGPGEGVRVVGAADAAPRALQYFGGFGIDGRDHRQPRRHILDDFQRIGELPVRNGLGVRQPDIRILGQGRGEFLMRDSAAECHAVGNPQRCRQLP